jgi:chromosome segregation ATPase
VIGRERRIGKMSEFKDNFSGILLAYLNDTFYTLDNSQCNELSKLVQGIEDDNARLIEEIERRDKFTADVTNPLIRRLTAELEQCRTMAIEREQYIKHADETISRLSWAHLKEIAVLSERIEKLTAELAAAQARIAELECDLEAYTQGPEPQDFKP